MKFAQVFDETEDLDADDLAQTPGQNFEKLNWLKAGFLSSDKLLTVSPNYAKEITSDPEKGVELDDVIRYAPQPADTSPGDQHSSHGPLTCSLSTESCDTSFVYFYCGGIWAHEVANVSK